MSPAPVRATLCLLALFSVLLGAPARSQPVLAPPDHVNVALARWGLAKATASSQYGPSYGPENVLDGRWAKRETDKWNTAAGAAPPHWLALDLGEAFLIDRVVVRHEGVLAEGERYNTADFRLQRGESARGPWTELVPPVRGNRENISTHPFAPVRARFLRLLVEKGEPRANEYARLFEVEVYAPVASLPRPLAGVEFVAPPQTRRAGQGYEQLAEVTAAAAPRFPAALRVEVAGQPARTLTIPQAGQPVPLWLPVRAGEPTEVRLAANGGPATAPIRLRSALSGILYFGGGTVRIVSSSHQDVAWMDTPQACRGFRVRQVLEPALELMRRNPGYCFVMENMLNLTELLEERPELRDEVTRAMKQGRLEWGATYTQPYEGLESGEQLIRQTYFGRRWLKKTFPGCDARVAFTPDVPGRSLQMQQILRKAGIPYLVTSRYHEGIHRWFSPDGSSVVVYTPGHYGNHSGILGAAPAEASRRLGEELDRWAPIYAGRGIAPAFLLFNSFDFSRPTSFDPLIDFWNSAASAGGSALGQSPNTPASPLPAPPRMQYSSIAGFFDALTRGNPQFHAVTGERPNVWLYIHGPTHQEAVAAQRAAGVLLPAAETFSSIRALLEGSFASYPERALRDAWRDCLFADHGWGGKNGHVTDALFRRKFEAARDTGRDCLNRALEAIASRVKSRPERGTPITVFNTVSWRRTDSVTVPLERLPEGALHLEDAAGRAVPCQVLDAPEEVNVAAAGRGATATANSALPGGEASKAIDGKWLEHDADKWCSAPGAAGTQWLKVDLGQAREVFRVVLRHEGSLGAFREEEKFNTSDFRLQKGEGPDGPWSDLVPPVTGNRDVLTVHEFPAQRLRYLRVLIDKPNSGADGIARLYELEAYAKLRPEHPRLLFVAAEVPGVGYKTYYLAGDGRRGTGYRPAAARAAMDRPSGPARSLHGAEALWGRVGRARNALLSGQASGGAGSGPARRASHGSSAGLQLHAMAARRAGAQWALASPGPSPVSGPPSSTRFENAFYRVELAPGGIRSLFDKTLGCEVLRTEKFLGGEVFTMRSVGNGAGEFGAVQQPTMEGFDRLANHKPAWRLSAEESGPVRSVYVLEQKLPDVTVREKLVAYHAIKRLDLEVSLLGWNGTKWREFRMAMPVNAPRGRVAYEVPMGVLEVGKGEIAGTGGHAYGNLTYYEECSKIRPREVQGFLDAGDDRLGLTLSSDVSVADYQDPTPNPAGYPILQPILLASRKSCHGEGNWYLQPGDHHYRFSLLAHAPGWRNGWRFGLQANRPLEAVVGARPVTNASLPEERGFLSLSAANVLLSTMKKGEDDDSVVVRCYDIEGRDRSVELSLPAPVKRASLTNLIEEEGAPLPLRGGRVRLKVGHYAIETLKVLPAGRTRADDSTRR